MGKRNQQRRAEKRRQKQKQARSGARFHQRLGDGGARPPSIEEVLDAAVEANWYRDPGLDVVLGILTEAAAAAGAAAAAMAVSGRLQRAVRNCWERGWQPADLARVAERKLGEAHRRLCVETIMAGAAAYLGGSASPDPVWLAQLEDLRDPAPAEPALFEPDGQPAVSGPELRRAVELIGMLEHAPALPRLGPPPSEWGSVACRGVPAAPVGDTRLLARVRALLVKAESTAFPEEAEALTTKAQELMARHAIDQAALDAADRPAVEGRRIPVDDPYAPAKAVLLQTVAEANRCRSVWSADLGFSTLFGLPGELRIAELLYTSLLTQATTAMVVAGRRGREARLPSFRPSFVAAFARRIGERLRHTVRAEVDAGVARHGEHLLPVLARRVQAVDDAVDTVFPGMTHRELRASNGFGWVAGRAAADLADLAVGERLGTPA